MMKTLPFVIITWIVLALSFQNCSGYFSTSGAFSSSSGGCSSSLSEMEPVFRRTFQPFFLKNTCVECHVPGGKQSGSPFAQADSFTALGAFQATGGPAVIEEKLQAGHEGPPYLDLKDELDEAIADWASQGFGECNNGLFTTGPAYLDIYDTVKDPATDLYRLRPEMINAPQTITWDLGEAPFDPVMPGVEVSIQVEAVVNEEGFPIRYIIRNPVFKAPANVKLKGIRVLLNGDSYQQNTWSQVDDFLFGDFAVPDGTEVPITILKNSDEIYSRADAWSLTFSSIEFVE